jgi:hypothetical protein
MSETFKKLQYKGGAALVLDAPAEFAPFLKEAGAPEKPETKAAKGAKYPFVLAFVKTGKERDALAPKALSAIEDDGVLWFAFPKKASKKYQTDCSRDAGWDVLGKAGFEPVRQVALDDDWTALRFRAAGRIGKMTRSRAISAEGAKRLKK